MQQNERVWTVAWALAQGAFLLFLHNWAEGYKDALPPFLLLLPCYALAFSVPFSMEMLSAYRAQRQLLALVAAYAVVQAACAAYVGDTMVAGDSPTRYSNAPIFMLGFTSFCTWFVLLAFAEHRLKHNAWFGDYGLLFAVTWRNALKMTMAGRFLGLFWGLIALWVGLFKVLKINFFGDFFFSRPFAYLASFGIYGLGLSLYSAKEDALANIYRSALNIIAWLLPLVSCLMLLFLLALPFNLQALWDTDHATALVSGLLLLMVLLFNAAWQDASTEPKFNSGLLHLIGLALISMPVYVLLCAYALHLRTEQYGWTETRIWAALLVAVLGIYGIGYAVVAIRRKPVWMSEAKLVNVAAALTLSAVLALTQTPVLNPVRIAVDNQVARLLSGIVPLDKFDFVYLRNNGGKYGIQALKKLETATGVADTSELHKKAADTLAYKPGGNNTYSPQDVADHLKTLQSRTTIYPKTAVVDQAFWDFMQKELARPSSNISHLFCIQFGSWCQLLSVDLDGDGQNEWVLFDQFASVLNKQQGQWQIIGYLRQSNTGAISTENRKALEQNQIKTEPGKWKDLYLGDQRFFVSETQL